MSSTTPPGGHEPEQGRPEVLEQGSGGPIPAEKGDGGGRRKALLAGGGVAALALVGVGAWAAVSFFATGAQPAEALPASTLGYVSIDLDPSGDQKIEAVKMLKKFPRFEDQIDLDTDDDIKARLFEELGVDEACDGVTYAADIEPWLGDRAALAALDLGEEQPTLAAVVQVKDAAAAEDGLAKLQECGGGDQGGWSIDGEWAVLAETASIAEQIAEKTATASLADDSDYQHWTDQVGDSGVVNLYAAPEAGAYLADSLEGLLGFGGIWVGGVDSATSCNYDSTMSQEELAEVMAECETSMGDPTSAPELPSGLSENLKDFEGMAVALRFDDGGLELEYAGDGSLAGADLPLSDAGDDVLSTLPDDTAVAVGLGFTDGWFGELLDQMAETSGTSVDELVAEAEAATGLDLPDDAEALAGESAAIAIGSDFDPDAFANSSTGSDVPMGVKVRGDAADIEAVLEKLRATLPPGPELASESDGDVVAFGPSADYVDTLLEDGGLGDVGAYQDVVDGADDAGTILFVNFDAGDWLDNVAAGDAGLSENLAPLEAFGISSWVEGEVAHAVLRLTTN